MIHLASALSHPAAVYVMRGCLCFLLFVGVTLLAQFQTDARILHSSQQSDEVRLLTVETPAERETSSGQSHAYQISLNAGDYLRIAINSRGIDLNLELFAPDGQKVIGVNTSHVSAGSNNVSLIAEVSGLHKLTVRPDRDDAKVGRYELKIETLRPATEQDKIRLSAEKVEAAAMWDKDHAPEKWREVIAKFKEALALWRQLGNRQGELRMLTRLGSEYENVGEPQIALNYIQEASQLAQALGDRYQVANLLLGFGNIHHRQDEGQKALEAYNQAKQIFASMSRPFGEAIATESIGLTYLSLGDAQLSLDHLKRAAQTYSSLKVSGFQCNTQNGIGTAYSKLGQPDLALESNRLALELARESHATACEGRALRQMGDVYLGQGARQKALESFNESLKICRAIGNRVCEAAALRGIGSISWLSGENEKSLDLLGQALNKFRLSGERSQEATTLHRLAQINQSIGNLGAAREQIEQGLDILESVRSRVISQQLRESFFVSAQSSFDLYIEVLMRLHEAHPTEGHDATALQASERARARGLLDLLSETRADIRQGVTPNLLELENSLQQRINAKAAALTRLLNDKRTESQAASIDKEIADLTTQYRDVRAQIRSVSPRYAALTQPQPLTADEIKRALDDNTVLLEFSLGEKQSWLWTVTRNALNGYKLPPRAVIESAARKFNELLTARQPKNGQTETQRLALIAEADAKLQTEAVAMSDMLLAQIATRLKQEWKGKRLAIVASGALEYLPFAALPQPEAVRQGARERAGENSRSPVAQSPSRSVALIADHEVVNLPSASVLASIRRETAGRHPAPKTLALVADPVFEPNDPRVISATRKKKSNENLIVNVRSADQSTAPNPETINSDLMRAVKSSNRAGFSRLPFSREEAEKIAELVPKHSLLKAMDFRANRTMTASGALGNYRIVHFATHGILNSELPELSGLVLSLIDENGKTQDGFLRMHDIFNLQLPADVVVLSACQTALGREVKGEGLVGLTRGFMYAGAQRVVASLWQVDDLATSQLMERFYRGMLKDGMRPAAALRAAQMEMMKSSRFASPYFWAAFVIQGEWR